MSFGYTVRLLETNLEWIRRQLKWLTAAKDCKASKYFDDEYKKFKAREESLVESLIVLRKGKRKKI